MISLHGLPAIGTIWLFTPKWHRVPLFQGEQIEIIEHWEYFPEHSNAIGLGEDTGMEYSFSRSGWSILRAESRLVEAHLATS